MAGADLNPCLALAQTETAKDSFPPSRAGKEMLSESLPGHRARSVASRRSFYGVFLDETPAIVYRFCSLR